MHRVPRTCIAIGLAAAATLVGGATVCQAKVTAVAVFNFQMKSDTPNWLWLEKGLADRLTTDLYQNPDIQLMSRDRMQETAERMKWVPEMMQDKRQLKKITFRARYIISGTLEVKNGSLSRSTGSERLLPRALTCRRLPTSS